MQYPMTTTEPERAKLTCTWTDCGMAGCSSCRTERRVYAPEHDVAARLCEPCAKRWTVRELTT